MRGLARVGDAYIAVGEIIARGISHATVWSSLNGRDWSRPSVLTDQSPTNGNSALYDVAAFETDIIAVGFGGIWHGGRNG